MQIAGEANILSRCEHSASAPAFLLTPLFPSPEFIDTRRGNPPQVRVSRCTPTSENGGALPARQRGHCFFAGIWAEKRQEFIAFNCLKALNNPC